MTKDPVQEKLQLQAKAYGYLLRGSEILLTQDSLYWTERILLKVIRALSERRVEQYLAVLPIISSKADSISVLKKSMIESAAEAALGGHELGQWQHVENGWQATCRLCDATIWVGENGLRYSLLADSCAVYRRG